MTTVSRTIHTSTERVWSVLADGWSYPLFVVGASRMRDVDDSWPAVGSKFHHSVGIWPALINDHTEVIEAETGTRLVLKARAWPLGEARVEFRLSPRGDRTEVDIDEVATSGPGALVPPPMKGLTMAWRNVETLRRLAFVAERRHAALLQPS